MATEVQKKEKASIQPAQGQVLSPFDRMERMFDEMFSRRWMRPWLRDWPFDVEESAFGGRIPKVDVIDRDEEVILRAELPGVKKEDLEITSSNSAVTIRAKTKREETEEKGEYYYRERMSGEFQRTIQLPENVNSDKAAAKFSDGILELKIPKTEPKKRHRIAVQ